MKITFLFGGAITAKQQAVIDAEIESDNEIEVVSSLSADADFDLLVYGNGFSGLEDLANAVYFADYEPEDPVIEPVSKKKKSRKSKTAAKLSGDE